MKKAWWKSKTLWVNVLTAAGLAAQELSGANYIDPKYVALILPAVNFGLRIITDKPVGK